MPAVADQSVHPHTGGELCNDRKPCGVRAGSSPHGWGTRLRGVVDVIFDRFIPTRVGNSHLLIILRRVNAVHPHTGGELFSDAVDDVFDIGSSPHGWGTRAERIVEIIKGRFIPTRVGNSESAKVQNCKTSVHPHTGGELLGQWQGNP